MTDKSLKHRFMNFAAASFSAIVLSSMAIVPVTSVAQGFERYNGNSVSSRALRTVSNLSVPLYKSHILTFPSPIKKISVGNPDIADILIMKSREVYILGKALGTTNVLLWDDADNLIKAFDVEVTHDLRTLREKLYRLLPKERIEVSTSQGAIVLSGHVSSLNAIDTAKKVAKSFIEQDKSVVDDGNSNKDPYDGVINLLSVGNSQQVMLKVTVAEVQRSLIRRWDMQFKTFFVGAERWSLGGVNGGAYFPNFLNQDGLELPVFPLAGGSAFNDGVWGPAAPAIQTSTFDIQDKGLFGSYLTDEFFFKFSLDAAKNSGFAKILSEPTLTTLTGQEANFISGGEFPIPVYDGDGRVAVTFKEFGIIVKFLPTVLDDQRIHLNIDVTASEINSTNAVLINQRETADFVIPGLTKRSTKSSIELADGQTMAIAGLINENIRDLTEKLPFLGDLPVLGTLFRSKDYIKGETELLIMVTPTLSKPLAKAQIALPTDGYVDPSDLEFYLMGKSAYKKTTNSSSTGSIPSAKKDAAALEATQATPINTVQKTGVTSGAFGHAKTGAGKAE